nr:ATP-binding protein [Rhizobium wenxiniae]
MPVIEGDGESLKQAFLNIIINALQAIERTGTIWISTCVQPNGVALIRFKDDGEGISEEDLEKIFDPFYSTKPNGTGLGLAMVHRIVDAHYGTVTITSKRGEGTEVSLRLPLLHHRTDELPST